jgi:hypothetical protein
MAHFYGPPEFGHVLRFFLLLAVFRGLVTGYDLVIPKNLPLKVFKSYLIQSMS